MSLQTLQLRLSKIHVRAPRRLVLADARSTQGMEMLLLTVFIVCVFIYGLVSRRLSGSLLTAPILFMACGIVAAKLIPAQDLTEGSLGNFLTIAELGLVLLLFSAASKTDLRELRRDGVLSARLLSVGMLLTIGCGAGLAVWIFPQLSWWHAGILAAILAPTDAGLGQVIVESKQVPKDVRESLEVEAGLNDGLSVPFLLFFIALSQAGTESDVSLMQFVIEQLVYGALIGAVIGLLGGALLEFSRRRDWMADSTQQLAIIALPVLCILAAEAFHASMFIAAFVAGLTTQYHYRDATPESWSFSAQTGEFLNYAVFFLFGLLAFEALPFINGWYVLYALGSLTIVRMVPVSLALLGSGLSWAKIAFMGWFGPRGLASIVLGLVFLEQQESSDTTELIKVAVIVTVLLSILLHGMSARVGINWLARRHGSGE